MDDEVDRLNRYAEDLMADRRPALEPLPTEQALRARQAAALFSAARPGADVPSRQFLSRFEGRIVRWIWERASNLWRA